MSDQQKIWFIYLTDHHEGPFTAEEIAEKAKAGLVSGASLAWKDGMPEWVPAETIPELASAVGGGGASAGAPQVSEPASPSLDLAVEPAGAGGAAPAASDGEVSLAQLLANQQKGETTTGGTGQIADSASVLSSMLGQVHKDNPVTMGSGVSIGGVPAPQQAPDSSEPPPDEDAWTLKIGAQVSGLHSLNRLKELASAGEIPPDAMVWHSGWSDFKPVNAVASLEAARSSGSTKTGTTKTGTTRGALGRPGVVSSGVATPMPGDDDQPTDTEIEAPPKGIQGILFKLKALLKKKNKPAKAATAPAAATLKGGKIALAPAPAPGRKAGAAARAGSAVKRLVTVFLVLIVLGGGGGAAWFFLLASPLPSDLDVTEEEKAAMNDVAKTKPDAGLKMMIAQATGTEDSPPDPTAPKYYVATNLPEGTTISMHVMGVPGTLVNRLSFEKTFSAMVDKTQLAVFEQINDNGKPLWGEFNFKVTAEGAEPLEVKGKFIGNRGGSYQSRLKTYKDNVQAEYDREVDELRQFITTLKAEQADASRLIKEYKEGWAMPTSRPKITADWTALTSKAGNFLGQIELKLKERLEGSQPPKYHARAFQDVATTTGQLQQLIRAHGDRMSGNLPSANPDELDGLVQAGVQALESLLAAAVARSPFDASPVEEPKSASPANPAPAVSQPAPAATEPAPAAP